MRCPSLVKGWDMVGHPELSGRPVACRLWGAAGALLLLLERRRQAVHPVRQVRHVDEVVAARLHLLRKSFVWQAKVMEVPRSGAGGVATLVRSARRLHHEDAVVEGWPNDRRRAPVHREVGVVGLPVEPVRLQVLLEAGAQCLRHEVRMVLWKHLRAHHVLETLDERCDPRIEREWRQQRSLVSIAAAPEGTLDKPR